MGEKCPNPAHRTSPLNEKNCAPRISLSGRGVNAAIAELATISRWVCWRIVSRKGKATKPPFTIGGKRASVTDRATWDAFGPAWAAAFAAASGFDGIGLVLTDDDDIMAADLDDCIDDAGTIAPWAMEAVTALASYTEISPSGRGLRMFFRSTMEGAGRVVSYQGGHLEIYSSGRYVTVTGDHLAGTPESINAVAPDVVAELLGSAKPNGAAGTRDTLGEILLVTPELQKRLDQAMRSSPRLKAVWNGEPPRGKDQTGSAFDLKLAGAMRRHGRFSFEDYAALAHRWTFGKGEEGDFRHYQRTWDKAGEGKARQQQRIARNAAAEPADDPRDDRETLQVKGGRLAINVFAAERIIGNATLDDPTTGVYQRGPMLVRVARVKDQPAATDPIKRPLDSLIIAQATSDFLRLQLAVLARWEKYSNRHRSYFDCDPPADVARTLGEAAGFWCHIPRLTGIVEAPCLRPDGSVFDTPGYDPATGLYFDPGRTPFSPIPAKPTRQQAQAALDLLLDILKGFPFVGEQDGEVSRAVAVAMNMTPSVRHAVRTAPLFGVSAPDQGSGKTLIGHLPAYISTGRAPTIMAQATNREEESKAVLTVLLEGSSVTLIDNVEGPFSSALLCKILTADKHSERLLGSNKSATVSTATTWIATGNNLEVVGDLTSRALQCLIDAKVEHPDQREFSVDLHEEVPARRGEFAAAILTIIRAYLAAGSPNVSLPVFGRFEDWSARVRAPLVWLGLPDPAISRSVVRKKNPIGRKLGDLLKAWYDVFGDSAQTVNTAIQSSQPPPTPPPGKEAHPRRDVEIALYNALEAIGGDGRSGQVNSRKIGHFLASYADRVENGYRAENAGTRSNAALWSVSLVSFVSSSPLTRETVNTQYGKCKIDENAPHIEPAGENSRNSRNSPPLSGRCSICSEQIDPGHDTVVCGEGRQAHAICFEIRQQDEPERP